ncbi:MAG: MYG1 family protein [bacterium]|nr:MYG1 family protein [bacterium]
MADPSVANSASGVAKIVTHPGGAHKDDLLACGVLAAMYRCPIERREPTPAEVTDPAVAIVDIGGVHEAAQNAFDHHHFPREHPPTCALSLVLQSLGLYDDALLFCDWLEPAEWFDSRGPNKTAEWLGVPRRAVSRLGSPIDGTLLRRFASQPSHRPGEVVYDFLALVGQDLVDYLRDVRQGIAAVEQASERWAVRVDGDELEVVFLPRSSGLLDDPSASVARYVRASEREVATAAMVYPDRRGSGYGITRYEDDPRLDFSRVEAEPDVHFAHKSGFMCKTSATAPARLQELVRLGFCGGGPDD